MQRFSYIFINKPRKFKILEKKSKWMTETKYQITTQIRGTDKKQTVDADSSWTIKVTLKGDDLQLGEKESAQKAQMTSEKSRLTYKFHKIFLTALRADF